jgi:hypothetical protein
MRRPLLIVASLAIVLAGAGAIALLHTRGHWQPFGGLGGGAAAVAKPDPEKYATLDADLERWRVDLARRHGAATDPAEQAQVLATARALLEAALPEMMRCWLGTPWDFNGMATQPGEGKIACGYFVATVLRDAGFQVDRIRLAQQPAELILTTFVPRQALTLRVGATYPDFCRDVRALEPGIYIVGLDNHVGFLVLTAEGFHFIHSSGSSPRCVVAEDSGQAHVLQRSRYRVLGNLTTQPELLRRWLDATPLAISAR